MKEFIVILATITLLIVFVMQYSVQQVNDYKINQFQLHVNVAKEKAKIAGRFTPEIKTELRNNILNTYKDITSAEIIMTVTETPKYRTTEFDDRELISFRIGVPIKKIIAGASLFGITNEQNKGYYIIEGYITSELIAP